MRAGPSSLDGLRRLRDTVIAAADLGSLLELVAEEARRAIGVSSLAIARLESGQVRVLVRVGRRARDEQRFPADEVEPVALGSDGVPVVVALSVHDVDADPARVIAMVAAGRVTELTVPIIIHGAPWGVVRVASAPGESGLALADQGLVAAAAADLAAVIEHSEGLSHLHRLAYGDPLTGLANRKAFEQVLDTLLADPTVTLGGLCVLLFDVDGLRELNLARGHVYGDDVLRVVATEAHRVAVGLPGGLAARVGGDEFVLVARVDAARALLMATTVSRAVTERMPGVSVSCGIAVLPEPLPTAAELLRLADAAQFTAKRDAPGRIAIAGGPSSEEPMAVSVRGPYRAYRDRTWNGLGRLIDEVLVRFDDSLRGALALERLEFVGWVCAEALKLPSWSVRERPAHTLDALVIVEGVVQGRHHGPRPELPGSLVGEAIDEQRVIVQRASDPDISVELAAALRDAGADAVLVSGAHADGRGFALELIGDASSVDLAKVASAVRLLTVGAVHGARRLH